MKVSILLGEENKFEVNLKDKEARDLFNDFVFSAMSKVASQEKFKDDRTTYLTRNTYSGNKKFYYLECEKCGRRQGFCTDRNMSRYRCDECRYETIVDTGRLRKLKLECDICNDTFMYLTNMKEEKPQMMCFRCGDIKNLFYFSRDNIYYIDKEV